MKLSGTVLGPSGALNNASVTAYAASLFSSPPVIGDLPPDGEQGVTIFGPANSGSQFGGNGQYELDVTPGVAYYLASFLPTYNTTPTYYWKYDGSLLATGGSSVQSLSGPGETDPQGDLYQGGGLSVDGTLVGVSGLELFGGFVGIGNTDSIIALLGGLLPVVVAAGVNDTFIYTPISTGTPETFTVAAGTYAQPGDVSTALGAALGTSSDPFSNYSSVGFEGNLLVLIATDDDTLASGPTDFLVSIGLAGTNTYSDNILPVIIYSEGFTVADQNAISLTTIGDFAIGSAALGVFGATPVAQIAGAGITTVAELVAALQSYGLLS